MNQQPDHINIRIGKLDSQQSAFAGGKDINQHVTQNQGGPAATELTASDRAQLLQLFAELKAQVEAEAPPDQQQAAVERVAELQEAVEAKEPDLTTMEYVKKWFVKHLPSLSGAVTGVIIHPIVGKVVEAAGDLIAHDFRQRFK